MNWIKLSEEKPVFKCECLILYYDPSVKGSHQWECAFWDDKKQIFYGFLPDDSQRFPDYWMPIDFSGLPPYDEANDPYRNDQP